MKQAAMYIDGQWTTSNATFDSVNPENGIVISKISVASPSDVERAVSAARKALVGWRAQSIEARANIVHGVAMLLRKGYGNAGERTALKSLITAESGKRLPEADIEVAESADMIDCFALRAPIVLQSKEVVLDQALWPTKCSRVVFEPRGVVAIIKPWNYPLELPLWSIGAAIVAGNTVVFKPSEHASLIGLEIARLFHEAGLPAGVLNVLTGGGEVGAQVAAHDDIDAVAFTGGQQTGATIAAACAKRLCRCTLELGGNDAAIVDADADLELAANGIVWGAFCNSGQVCVRVKRLFVDDRVADELISKIALRTRQLRYLVDYGPLISAAQRARVAAQLSDALDRGARVVATASIPDQAGGFPFAPVVITEVASDSRLLQEECFGPVLPIIRVADATEGIRLANASKYGLGASVWTSNLERGREIASALEVGMVWINDVNVALPQAPWGGIKKSGYGVELSDYGLLEYVHPKHVCEEQGLDITRPWWYPYTAS